MRAVVVSLAAAQAPCIKSSWQTGGNTGVIRKQLKLNTRPRKIHGFLMPCEVYAAHLRDAQAAQFN